MSTQPANEEGVIFPNLESDLNTILEEEGEEDEDMFDIGAVGIERRRAAMEGLHGELQAHLRSGHARLRAANIRLRGHARGNGGVYDRGNVGVDGGGNVGVGVRGGNRRDDGGNAGGNAGGVGVDGGNRRDDGGNAGGVGVDGGNRRDDGGNAGGNAGGNVGGVDGGNGGVDGGNGGGVDSAPSPFVFRSRLFRCIHAYCNSFLRVLREFLNFPLRFPHSFMVCLYSAFKRLLRVMESLGIPLFQILSFVSFVVTLFETYGEIFFQIQSIFSKETTFDQKGNTVVKLFLKGLSLTTTFCFYSMLYLILGVIDGNKRKHFVSLVAHIYYGLFRLVNIPLKCFGLSPVELSPRSPFVTALLAFNIQVFAIYPNFVRKHFDFSARFFSKLISILRDVSILFRRVGKHLHVSENELGEKEMFLSKKMDELETEKEFILKRLFKTLSSPLQSSSLGIRDGSGSFSPTSSNKKNGEESVKGGHHFFHDVPSKAGGGAGRRLFSSFHSSSPSQSTSRDVSGDQVPHSNRWQRLAGGFHGFGNGADYFSR